MGLKQKTVLMSLFVAVAVGAMLVPASAVPISIGVYAQSPFEFEGLLPVTSDFKLSVGARAWFLENIGAGFWARLAPNWVQTTGYLFEGSYRLIDNATQSVWSSVGVWMDLNPLEFALFGLLEAVVVRQGPLDFGVGLWTKLYPNAIEVGLRLSGYVSFDFFPNPNRKAN